jgi:hypothetical protein
MPPGLRARPPRCPWHLAPAWFADQVARFFAVFGHGALRFLGIDPDDRLNLRTLNVGGQPRSLALPRVLGARSKIVVLGRRLN